MEKQITSYKQSKRLIEMGVPAEKASMVWRKWVYQHFERDRTDEIKYELDVIDSHQRDPEKSDIPAFTVADLLCLLPKSITTPQGKVHTLHIEACSSTSPRWCLFWGDEAVQIGWQERLSITHLLEDAIEWLVSNGYKLEV